MTIRQNCLLACSILYLGAIVSCSTVEGLGRDMQAVGSSIQKSSQAASSSPAKPSTSPEQSVAPVSAPDSGAAGALVTPIK
jgi:predicted small secreted protein